MLAWGPLVWQQRSHCSSETLGRWRRGMVVFMASMTWWATHTRDLSARWVLDLSTSASARWCSICDARPGVTP